MGGERGHDQQKRGGGKNQVNTRRVLPPLPRPPPRHLLPSRLRRLHPHRRPRPHLRPHPLLPHLQRGELRPFPFPSLYREFQVSSGSSNAASDSLCLCQLWNYEFVSFGWGGGRARYREEKKMRR